MRPDGRGGWYAVVAVVWRGTGVPRNGLDEHYVLQIVGTQAAVHLFVTDEFVDWWHGDRFVAHLRPHRQDGQAAGPGNAHLKVTGLVPIEAGDTTTLEDIVDGRRPMPETERGWPREWHVRVTVAVTPDRRWRTTG